MSTAWLHLTARVFRVSCVCGLRISAISINSCDVDLNTPEYAGILIFVAVGPISFFRAAEWYATAQSTYTESNFPQTSSNPTAYTTSKGALDRPRCAIAVP